MIPGITFRQWQGMFTRRIEKRNREEAFNILENMRSLSQFEGNKMSDEQLEIWFNMVAVFNQTFPDNPICLGNQDE